MTTGQGNRWKCTFPACRLHGGRIVDHLPSGCPLGHDRPGEPINRLQDQAFRLMDVRTSHHDPARGLSILAQAWTCSAYIGRNLRSPTVMLLRRQPNSKGLSDGMQDILRRGSQEGEP